MIGGRVGRLRARAGSAWNQLEDLLHLQDRDTSRLADALETYRPGNQGLTARLREALASARAARSPPEHARAHRRLRDVLGDVDRAREDAPALRASVRFQLVRARLEALSVAIDAKGVQYNQAATRYNTCLDQVPSKLSRLRPIHHHRPLFRPPDPPTAPPASRDGRQARDRGLVANARGRR